MNINFELFKIFYAVANQQSISKAAEELLISQPAVTQAIHSLENQIGGVLFIRTKKGVQLTEEGKQLYGFIKEGMAYFINGIHNFQQLKDLDSGKIRIGASSVICEYFLMPYLKQFSERYPNVSISILNHLTTELIKQLRNGSVDILIIAIEEKEYKDFKVIPFAELHDIFVCNRPISKSTLQELLQQKIIVQQNPSVNRQSLENYIKKEKIEWSPFMEVASQRLVINFTKNGFGIGYVTKEYVQQELKEKTLYEIQIDHILPTRHLGIILLNNNIPSYSVKKFIDLLQK